MGTRAGLKLRWGIEFRNSIESEGIRLSIKLFVLFNHEFHQFFENLILFN